MYLVSDGIDRYLVGFLPRHLLPYREQYDGKVAQVVEFYKGSESPATRRSPHKNRGMCVVVLIEADRYLICTNRNTCHYVLRIEIDDPARIRPQ